MKPACWMLAMALPLAAQVKLPHYTRQLLPNGTVMVLMPKKDVPMTTLRAVIRGGAECDPEGLGGLASVTAELLRRGTATRTADQFSEQLDQIGASFASSADEQSTIIGMEFLSKDADRALDLFADAILRPTFPEAEVKKVIAQRIDAAKAAKDNPQMAMVNYFRPFFYAAGHPYARPVTGDELSLARLERKHLADYHKRSYCGKNLTLVVAGDFEAQKFGPRLAKAFEAAPEGASHVWVKAPPSAERGSSRLLLVDKPDATQTYFMIAQPGIHRRHPDRIALWLVNTVFGGRFTSMLNDELRVNSGLTYGAFCRLDQNRLTGGITISSYTPTETTVKAVDLALDVLKRLGEKGITDEQLASAKAYIKGTYPSDRLETADQLAAVLGEIELYDLDRTEVDDLFAKIDAVTLEQANGAARKYYRREYLQFLLLGSAGKIRQAVAKYSPNAAEISITTPGFGGQAPATRQ